MRKFILAIVLLLAVLFVIANFAEFKNITATLQRGDWRFLVAAFCVQLMWFASVGAAYKFNYRALGMEVSHQRLLRLAIASDFVSIIVPSGGLSGVSVFVSDAQNRGDSTARAAVAGVLNTLFDYTAFLFILGIGTLVLIHRSDLSWAQITASVYLILIAAGLGTLLLLGMRSARQLGNVLFWLAHRLNRLLWPFIKRNYLSEEQARGFAHDAAEGIQCLRQEPRRMALPLLFALCSKLLLISILTLSFLAFKVPFSAGTIIAGFGTSYLFLVVSPVPAGIGVFEGAMTLAFNSLHVTLADAAVVTLTYRAVTFWFPLILGYPIFHSINAIKPKAIPSSQDS
jgi:hypothetical protein